MKARRGVALLAALWLVVAIAAVAVQFSIDARERRTIGILAAERGVQRALAVGALASVRAQMDQAMRTLTQGANATSLRASDPWLDLASIFNGQVMVDSTPVDVAVLDLGERLNINQVLEVDLRNFFSFLLSDFSKAQHLAQAVLDWRDADTLPRPTGAEVDAYVKAELLALPTNGPFRDVDDVRNVFGMTPEIFATVSPYLTVRGPAQINLNTAPAPVLRALPGMTDQLLNMILMMRSQGRRINNVNDVVQGVIGGGRGGRGGGAGGNPTAAAFNGRAVTSSTQIEMTFTARSGPQSQPTKLVAVLRRGGEGGGTAIVSLIW
jgi:type II secretory pathway component PulK